MKTKRAEEILESLGVIEVLHKGSPVWIEDIKGDNANIQYLETNQRAQVPVLELIEA